MLALKPRLQHGLGRCTKSRLVHRGTPVLLCTNSAGCQLGAPRKSPQLFRVVSELPHRVARCRSSLVFAATARAGRVTGGCRRDLVQGGTGPRRLPRTRGWASGRCPLCRTCNRESSRSGSTFHRSARAAGVSRLMARVLVRVWFRRIQGLLYRQHPRVRATLGFHQACRHPSGRAPGPLIVKRRVRVRPVRHLLMGRVGSQRPEPVVM